MRNLSLQSGIGTDPAYLNGNLVDNQTIIGEGINQDLVQFFQKLAALASITPNNLPDNETNGYQLITAFEAVVRAYAASTTQRGTSERATQTEVNTGTDTERYIAPNTLRGTTFVDSQIPLLDAAKIPNLDASKITTGIFDPAIIPQATESTLGGAEVATQAEAYAKSDDTKMLTPAKLASFNASSTFAGLVELATSAESIAMTDTLKAITPYGLGSLFKNVWSTATLDSGWTVLSSQNLRYRLFGTLLHIIGYIEKDTTSTSRITTLPSGFRPSSTIWFPVNSTFIFNYYDSISSLPGNLDACYLETDGELRYAASTNIAYRLVINAIIPLSF